MAMRWRIRHKLLIGLGLVVAVMALLLAGTLEGLASFRATMNNVDSKLAELDAAQKLQLAIGQLTAPPDAAGDTMDEAAQLRGKVRDARAALGTYRERLRATLERGRDPDKGFNELALAGENGELERRFNELEQALTKFAGPSMSTEGSQPLRSRPPVSMAIARLAVASNDLQAVINEELFRRIHDAKAHNKTSIWVVVLTSVGSVALMAALLRFFYGWVFYPVRDLEAGACRLARGDFGQRIEVHSGDEMEDLAAAFNDMTRRLREMYDDLERQVNERSRQLVRSERLASVGFLAAGVAHEINNPLHAIALCSEALEGRLRDLLAGRAGGDGQRATVERYLKTIQEEAFRCKAITEKLLDFSRGGEKKREPAELTDLVQSVLDVAQHLQNCKGKRIVFQPAGRVVAWVNVMELKSVVLNLVVNALDSMEDGGTLTITLRQRDGRAEVVFADTGCGMTAEVLENIFEPFFTKSRTGKGTGLGLTISHRVISQHGGEIEAASAGPNQGSTFTVRLPLQPAENSDPPSAISSQPALTSAQAA